MCLASAKDTEGNRTGGKAISMSLYEPIRRQEATGLCSDTTESEGKSPFVMDSKYPTIPYQDQAYGENRFMTLKRSDPERAGKLMKQADAAVQRKLSYLKHMANWLPSQE
jgi:hypothetical protein